MPVDHLWAIWRSNYVNSISDSRADDGLSLFERILAAPGTDEERGIVARGERCFVLLNRFPYTSGHLMVLPNDATADLEELDEETHAELWSLVRSSVVAVKSTRSALSLVRV